MRTVYFDAGFRMDDVNIRWADPAYLLEKGDPGWVNDPNSASYVAPNPKPQRKMAELTDADQKAYINKIIATIKQADIKARLTAGGWDPTQRTTNLENGNASIMGDEGIISNLEAALSTAVATRRTDINNNYALASATLSAIEGALGKDDQLVRDLHQFRSSLSHAPKKPTGGTPPPA